MSVERFILIGSLLDFLQADSVQLFVGCSEVVEMIVRESGLVVVRVKPEGWVQLVAVPEGDFVRMEGHRRIALSF
ncbi:hypothetical protein D3C73_1363400 [compost metagenome]